MILLYFFFLNDTATTEIYTLSLHDALPICARVGGNEGDRDRRSGRTRDGAGPDVGRPRARAAARRPCRGAHRCRGDAERSEEHTSELQSRQYLVCRLLLEKKKTKPFSILQP